MDEDFDLDLDFLEPSKDIIERISQNPEKRTTRSSGKNKSKRVIYGIDSDEEGSGSSPSKEDSEEEEFVILKDRNKKMIDDEDNN